MAPTTHYLTTTDQHRIALHHWPSELAQPKGVMHWLHGMAEHGLRYARLASAFNAAGWEFYVHDHRGHGQSTDSDCPVGHFADKNGWKKALGDVSTVQQWLRMEHIDIPMAMGGHSMGSFFALNWAQYYADVLPLAGLVLAGSDYRAPSSHTLNTLLISFERFRNGARGTSPLIRRVTFGAWAKKFAEDKSDSAWLTSLKEEQALYDNDALCGFDCTTQLWLDLIGALRHIHRRSKLAKLPAALPILLLTGTDDPMSDFSSNVVALQEVLQQTGSQQVTLKRYEGSRHEVLNDRSRDQAMADLLHWLTPQ